MSVSLRRPQPGVVSASFAPSFSVASSAWPPLGAQRWKMMLFGEDVGVEIRHPLLAFLRHTKIGECPTNVGTHRRPKERGILGTQFGGRLVAELVGHTGFSEFHEEGRSLPHVVWVGQLPDEVRRP